MRTLNTKAIILGHREFGESNKIIYIYSEDLGKTLCLAKGARKIKSKFTGHLETGSICEISLYFGPKNTILTEIITIKSSGLIRENIEKLTSLLQICEITDRMIFEGQKIDGLFNLIEKSITNIENSENPQIISIAYIIKILDKLGLMPNIRETKTSLADKYQNFIHFIQIKDIRESAKIRLTKEENSFIINLLKELIEKETERKFNSLNFLSH